MSETEAEALPAKRKKGIHIGAPKCYLLELACKQVAEAFGEHCYLVGSCLERADWRDVDVRFIMEDPAFDALFPGTLKNKTWKFDARWLLLTASISAHLAAATGLPIDFQFQPQTHANDRHKGSRSAIGLTFAKE